MSVPNKCTCELCGASDNRRTSRAMNPDAIRLSDFPRRSRPGKRLASRTRRARDARAVRALFSEATTA